MKNGPWKVLSIDIVVNIINGIPKISTCHLMSIFPSPHSKRMSAVSTQYDVKCLLPQLDRAFEVETDPRATIKDIKKGIEGC
jgi:hypothetical protein